MLQDHSNKWKQKHTSFWWKPLGTNHKLPHSSTLIVFLRENELFQRGWGVFVTLVEIPKGWGGHQFPAKMENPGRWGGPKWNSLRGGGLDTFWNYTILNIYLSWQNLFAVILQRAIPQWVHSTFQWQMKFLFWYKLAHKAFFLFGIIFAVLFVVFSRYVFLVRSCFVVSRVLSTAVALWFLHCYMHP